MADKPRGLPIDHSDHSRRLGSMSTSTPQSHLMASFSQFKSSSSSSSSSPSTSSPAIRPVIYAATPTMSAERKTNNAPVASTAMGADVTAHNKKGALDISSLMSPPDPVPLDNFNQTSAIRQSAPVTHSPSATPKADALMSARHPAKPAAIAAKPSMPMSPPVSPQTSSNDNNDRHRKNVTPGHNTTKDPILYPRDDGFPSPPQQPLFPVDESAEHRRLVDSHMNARHTSPFKMLNPPVREDYELALLFHSQMMESVGRDPKRWRSREKQFLLNTRRLNHEKWHGKRYTNIAPAKSAAPAAASHSSSSAASPTATRITIRAPGSGSGAGSAASVLTASRGHKPLTTRTDRVVKPAQAARAPRASNATRKPRVSATPEPGMGRGRSGVAPNREDRDFAALEDICPPSMDSLPKKPNSLKVDWKGAPVDLSHDPNLHLLHPDEQALAANLRLDCATYLTSKRRIFLRRRECARVGKEFRKTDAQQACKIDVNKASKLWTAFDKVGWLDIKWMRSHM